MGEGDRSQSPPGRAEETCDDDEEYEANEEDETYEPNEEDEKYQSPPSYYTGEILPEVLQRYRAYQEPLRRQSGQAYEDDEKMQERPHDQEIRILRAAVSTLENVTTKKGVSFADLASYVGGPPGTQQHVATKTESTHNVLTEPRRKRSRHQSECSFSEWLYRCYIP